MAAQSKPWDNVANGTMRAAVVSPSATTPPADCFQTATSYPKPSLPGPDWLLVKVYATGLNRAELRARAGEANIAPEWGVWSSHWSPEASIPGVLGEEFVGIVEEVGSNAAAQGWKVGDRAAAVYYGGGKAYSGAYAEYTIAHYDVVRHLPGPDKLQIANNPAPGTVSWVELGAVPGSAWTAWGSLFQSADTKPGQTVLIHGATSSVGVWAVLLAKLKGCKVIATTRQTSKVEKLKAAGADHVIVEKGPGNDEKVYEELAKEILAIVPGGANTFFELVNPNSVTSLAFKCTAMYGYIVVSGVLSKIWTMQGVFSPLMIPGTRKMTVHTGCVPLDQFQECLNQVVAAMQDGTFKREAYLDSVYTLEDVGKAHERMENNEATGKVVLDVAGA